MSREKKHEATGWGGRDQHEVKKVAEAPNNQGCLRIFVLPHMIAGVFIFYLCVMMVAPEVAGTNCAGTAHKNHEKHKTSTSHSDSQDGPALEVTFEANGKTYTVNPRVDYSFYSAVTDGAKVPVKYWSLAPEQSAFVNYPGNKHFKWFLIIFSFFWNSIMLLMFVALYVSPVMIALGLWQPPSIAVPVSNRD